MNTNDRPAEAFATDNGTNTGEHIATTGTTHEASQVADKPEITMHIDDTAGPQGLAAEHTATTGTDTAEHTLPEGQGAAEHTAATGTDTAEHTLPEGQGAAEHVEPVAAVIPPATEAGAGDKGHRNAHRHQRKQRHDPVNDLRKKYQDNQHVWLTFTEVAEDHQGKPTGLIARFCGKVRVFLSLKDIPSGVDAHTLLNSGFKEARLKPIIKPSSIQVSLDLSDEAKKRDEATAQRIQYKDNAKAKLAAWDQHRKARAAAFAALPPRDSWIDTVIKESYVRKDQSRAWHLIIAEGFDDGYLPEKFVPAAFPRENLEDGKPLTVRIAYIDNEKQSVTLSLLPAPTPASRDTRSSNRHDNKGGNRHNQTDGAHRHQPNDHRQAELSPREMSFNALPAVFTQMHLTVSRVSVQGKDAWAAFLPAGEGLELYLPSRNVPEGYLPEGKTSLQPGDEVDAWLVSKNPNKKQGTLSLKDPGESPRPERGPKPNSERADNARKHETRDASQAEAGDQGSERSSRRRSRRNRNRVRNDSSEGEGRHEGGTPHREERRERQHQHQAEAAPASADNDSTTHGAAGTAAKADFSAGNKKHKGRATTAGAQAARVTPPKVTGLVDGQDDTVVVKTDQGDVTMGKDGKFKGGHGSLALLAFMKGGVPAEPVAAPKPPKVKKSPGKAAAQPVAAETDAPVAETSAVEQPTGDGAAAQAAVTHPAADGEPAAAVATVAEAQPEATGGAAEGPSQ